MDFCVSHFRTEDEAMYCMQKILENVEYDTPEYKAEPVSLLAATS